MRTLRHEAFYCSRLNGHDALLAHERGRRRLVRVALNIAQGTPLAPKLYERVLLDQFVRGA